MWDNFYSVSIVFMMLLPVCMSARNTDTLSVHFEISDSRVDTALAGNREKLDSVERIIMRYSSNPGFSMTMTGGASPEGTVRYNAYLAARRVEAVLDYFEERFGDRFPKEAVDTSSIGADWKGLERLISDGMVFEGSEQVLSIIRNVPFYVIENGKITGGRKKSLMDLHRGDVFRYMMDNVFPELRQVSLTVCYTRPDPLLPLDFSMPVYAVGEPLSGKPVLHGGGPRQGYDGRTQYTSSADVTDPTYRMALKTNLLSDAALMPSLEAEYLINEHWSVAAHGAVAWWSRDAAHKYYQIATIYPEARWWFKTRKPWHGHYLGVFAGGSWYDLENGGRGYKGEAGFVGLSYGYMFPIARRLSIEAGIGAGYMYTGYEEYLPVPYMGGTHYVYQQTSRMNYFGPLKLKLALVWRLWEKDRKGGVR